MNVKPCPHTLKCALLSYYASPALTMLNTFYLQDTSDAVFTDLVATAGLIETACSTNLVPVTRSNVAYFAVELEDIRTVPFGGGTFSFSAAQTGAVAATEHIPPNNCIAVKRGTADLTRSGRGRWYWPITDAGDLVGGTQANTTFAASVRDALNDFQVELEASLNPALFGIVSYQAAKVALNPGVFKRVTGWSLVDYNVDSQRRRLAGRGM